MFNFKKKDDSDNNEKTEVTEQEYIQKLEEELKKYQQNNAELEASLKKMELQKNDFQLDVELQKYTQKYDVRDRKALKSVLKDQYELEYNDDCIANLKSSILDVMQHKTYIIDEVRNIGGAGTNPANSDISNKMTYSKSDLKNMSATDINKNWLNISAQLQNKSL